MSPIIYNWLPFTHTHIVTLIHMVWIEIPGSDGNVGDQDPERLWPPKQWQLPGLEPMPMPRGTSVSFPPPPPSQAAPLHRGRGSPTRGRSQAFWSTNLYLLKIQCPVSVTSETVITGKGGKQGSCLMRTIQPSEPASSFSSWKNSSNLRSHWCQTEHDRAGHKF